MHKSSPFTLFFKYVFPLFAIAMMTSISLFLWNEGTPDAQNTVKGMLFLFAWMAFFIVQMPFRLQTLTADESGITYTLNGKEKTIAYKDVQWVSMLDISSPWFMTVKFYDAATGEYRKIAYLPNKNNQVPFQDDAMTQYIKQKVQSENSSYSKNSQPSLVKNVMLLTALGLPFTLTALYFIFGF